MSGSPDSQRLDVIHCLRGAAALSVCLLHISTATVHVFPPSVLAIAGVGAYGVPVFFIISGFVVPFSLVGRGYGIKYFPRFVARRMMRLDPPYFAALALALLLAFTRSLRGSPFPFGAADVALHAGYLNGLAGRPWALTPFWTLGIEFQYYLLIGLAMAALLPIARRLTTAAWKGPILLGMLLAVFFLLSELERQLHSYYTDDQLSGLWLLYRNGFLLGSAALIVRLRQMSVFALLAFGLIVFAWSASLWRESTAVLLGMAVLIASAPAAWRWMRHGAGRAIAGLGTISYSLYVTHQLVAGLLVNQFVTRGLMPESGPLVWLVVSAELALCLSFATGFYLLFERPAWRWSKRLAVTPVATRRRDDEPVLAPVTP